MKTKSTPLMLLESTRRALADLATRLKVDMSPLADSLLRRGLDLPPEEHDPRGNPNLIMYGRPTKEPKPHSEKEKT